MKKVKLSDIATVTAGNVAPKTKDFTVDGVPFVRAGSLSSLLETGDFSQLETINSAAASRLRLRLFPAGTVVFAKSGMSCLKGYVYTLPRECYVVSHLACVTPKEGYSQYLKHYFRYWKPSRLIENPSFPSIKLSKISDIELDLPDGDSAREIVDNLEAVLEAIDAEQLQINKLNKLVKSRFVEMFGDVSGEYRRLEDCCVKVMGGKTPSMKHPEYYGGGIPFIKSGDVKEDVVSSGALWLSDEAVEKASVKLVPAGSVLVVVRSALLKRKVCISICSCDVAINQDIRAFVPKPEFTSSYLLWSIRSHEQDLLNRVRSVNTSGMDMKQLYDLNICVAPIAKQQEFAAFVQQVDKLKFETQQAIDKLQMLYDSLAQEYFGGE